ncbi:MAG: hypothetical protein HKN79_11720 [Flavobacteriales bacterium]|nr:hypothetical protein [Flavobacteriales bacterium]
MGIFGRLFGKREKLIEPADISSLKVDIHSHLIPGIDDGAQDMEESLALLRRFEALGFQKVITTPHIMADYYRNTPDIILGGLEKVRAAIKKEGMEIQIEAAAEYYLDDRFEQLLDDEDLLTFGSKRYLLFELPFVAEPLNLNSAIFNMQLKGIKPVLAHPERYGFWSRDLEKYEELHDKGVILQINLNSLGGYYGPEVKKVADHLVEQELIGLVGTDCHRSDHLDALEQVTLRVPSFHRLLEQGKLINSTL